MNVAKAPSRKVVTESPSPAVSMRPRVRKCSSATGGWRDQGQLGALVEGCVPLCILLVDSAAEHRPHSGEPGLTSAQLIEDGSHCAPLPRFKLKARGAQDLPWAGEEEDGDLQAGSRRRSSPTSWRRWRVDPALCTAWLSVAGRIGAATCQWTRQSQIDEPRLTPHALEKAGPPSLDWRGSAADVGHLDPVTR